MSGMSCPVHRFIPAYAGNARRFSMNGPAKAVHPRIRGERLHGFYASHAKPGSSPHTRGTRPGEVHIVPVARFIPAYAGNAEFSMRVPMIHPVHPRIRGERLMAAQFRRYRNGSSPHTRGTRRDHDGLQSATRFIPAYAGNAEADLSLMSMLAVHPRIRGERTDGCVNLLPADGSSPHTRGTLS